MVCAILTARTTVFSSSLGILRTLVEAMRPYAITKLCASSRQVVNIMQEERPAHLFHFSRMHSGKGSSQPFGFLIGVIPVLNLHTSRNSSFAYVMTGRPSKVVKFS